MDDTSSSSTTIAAAATVRKATPSLVDGVAAPADGTAPDGGRASATGSASASATGASASASASAPDDDHGSTGTGNHYYYEKGSVELAVETPAMLKRLETRRKLTTTNYYYNGDDYDHGAGETNRPAATGTAAATAAAGTTRTVVVVERLLIVLVGLPARGKSFIARKLLNYLTWRGNQCRIFNVGKYRREAAVVVVPVCQQDPHHPQDHSQDHQPPIRPPPQQDANFFDDANEEAARLREEAAQRALRATLDWLEDDDNDNNDNNNDNGDVNVSTARAATRRTDTDPVEVPPVPVGHVSYSAQRQYHRIAIFDATNSTRKRRQWILEECDKADHVSGRRTGVIFLESICDDHELLEENLRVKIQSCPDFDHLSVDEALLDLRSRIEKYESRYEPMDDPHQSYIKIFNLSSRLMVNHIYGRLAKVVLPAIMAWNTGSRPILLCRAGETHAMQRYMEELQQQQQLQPNKDGQEHVNVHQTETVFGTSVVDNRLRRKRSDRLGERGLRFREALCDFVEREGSNFMKRKNHVVKGTSISGLHEEEQDQQQDEEENEGGDDPRHSCSSAMDQDRKIMDDTATATATTTTIRRRIGRFNPAFNATPLPFPCLVMSSTMPRAIETATWNNKYPLMQIKDVSNLNPLDMGDFSGMDLASICRLHPDWYEQLKQNPFYTRFPGGESYADLIDRLTSIIIDIEQQLGLAVVVSHVSILQVLISYFRSTPIHECMNIEIPMHTVMKFVPLRGGGWLESRHPLLPDGDMLEMTTRRQGSATEEHPPSGTDHDPSRAEDEPPPIWGDSRSCLPHRLSLENLQMEDPTFE